MSGDEGASGGVVPMEVLGARLRRARVDRGWTLADLAEQSGLSTSFLSLVENGSSDISMGRLARLLDPLALSLTDLTDVAPASPQDPVEREVRRTGDHPVLATPSGVHTVVLGRSATHGALRVLITLDPGAEVDISDFVARRSGETFVLVLSGEFVVSFRDGSTESISTGDTLAFPSTTVGSSRNAGEVPATAYVEHPGH
jgi:transcriptional regulator with XRE-family HTH domain